ncbi:MAG: hypothetical protein HY680_07230 [Chloroflexi bacterium]|nr:hypothetical protein [Chloroflexota bacterium]
MTFLTKVKLALAFIAILAVVGAALYFGGLLQGRGVVDAQRRDYEARLEAAQSENLKLMSRLAAEQARGLLYRAAAELDRRNFGTANSYLKEAAKALESLNPGDAGFESSKVSSLRQAVESVNISVTENLEVQRERVLRAAAQLDDLLKQ